MANEPTSTTPKVSPFRAGIATMLVGAALLGVGMLQTTTATYQTGCPQGTELVAKFEYDDGKYEYEGSHANRNVVKITNGKKSGGNWTSTRSIAAIVVKGGPGSKIMTLNPPQKSGSFNNNGLTTGGKGKNTPDISHVLFCEPKGGGTTTTSTTSTTTTTTTTSTTTSTTTTTTTSTVPEETTTTTTEPEETTTTTTSTSTTTSSVPEEETTTTSTTEPEGTTTSTTEPEESTTTTEPQGTTTTTEPDGEVQGRVVVNTTIIPDDAARVLSASEARALPRTGAPSIPLVVIGIVLLGAGGTLTIVNRRRGTES